MQTTILSEPTSASTIVKSLIPVLCVILGAVLGQGAAFLQKWLEYRRIIRGLDEELKDLATRAKDLGKKYEDRLRECHKKTPPSLFPTNLQNPIYTKYYVDVCHKMDHNRRLSFQYIHGVANGFNEKILIEKELFERYFKKKDSKILERWENEILRQCRTLWMLEKNIELSLDKKKEPVRDKLDQIRFNNEWQEEEIRLRRAL